MHAYLAELPSLQAAGKHLSVDHNRIVALVELELGDAMARLGKAEEAHKLWVSARTRLKAAAAGARLEELALLARAQSRLGQRSEAMGLVERLRDSKFRHPAYVEMPAPLLRGAGVGQIKPDN